MSLVHDYLKLTQKDISTHEAAGEVPPALLSGKRRKGRKAYKPIWFLLAAGLVAVISFRFLPYFQKNDSVTPAQGPAAEFVKEEALPPVPVLEKETALPATAVAVKTGAESLQASRVAVKLPMPLPQIKEQELPLTRMIIKKEPVAGKAEAPVQKVVKPVETVAAVEQKKAPAIGGTGAGTATVKVAEAEVEAEKPLAAAPDLRREAAVSADSFDRFFQAGMMAQQAGKLQTAEGFYLKALKSGPPSIEILNNLSAAYVGQGKYDLAEETLNSILAREPSNSKALVNLGVISLHRQQQERAKALLLEALQFNPHEETALVNMAYISQKEGNNSQAEKYYREAIKISPAKAELLLAYGSLLEGERRYAEARDRYRQSLELEDVKADRRLYEKIKDRIQVLGSY